MKKRLLELDLIRAVAMLLVIFQHAWSMIGLDEPAQAFSYHGYSALIYGVPLFIMLSGFFQIKWEGPVGTYLKTRFARILPPFFLWMVIAYAISAATHKYAEVNTWRDAILQFVPFFITNRVNSAFWYVFLLSGLYLITPVLQRAFAAPDRKALLQYCLILWFAVALLNDFLPQFEALNLFPIAGRYLGYYLAGFYICTFMNDRRLNRRIGVPLLAGAFALNVCLKYGGHSYAVLEILEVLGAFLLLKSVRLQESPAATVITNISRYSYTIYLSHFILIRFLYAYLPAYFPFHWATPLYTSVLVLVAEYLFCWLLDKLKPVPKRLVGIG